MGTGDTSFPRTEYENPRPLLTEDCGGAYWTRTSDPIDVNDVLYQLSQSTMDLCEPILAFCPPRHIHGALRIGSSVMYISQYVLPTEPKHQGLPPDAVHRKQHLLYSYPGRLSRLAAGKFSVIRLGERRRRGEWGMSPAPRLCCSAHAHLPVPAPADKPPRTLAVQLTRLPAPADRLLHEHFAVQLTRAFPPPYPRTGPPRTLCCSAHARFPAPAPTDRLSENALLLQRTRVILPAFIS